MGIQQWYEQLLCFFFPKRCIFCNEVVEPQRLCCDSCAQTVHLVAPPLCPYCGCHKKDCKCKKHRHYYDRAVAPFYYKDAVRSGILRLKKWDDPYAVRYFASNMTAALRREFPQLPFDAVCHIPMTKRDKRTRQYNQGELLAREISKSTGIPRWDALVKIYETTPQKRLKRWQRKGNVLGVFDVVRPVKDARILLVDDLLTSGSSLDECAKMLLICGAKSVTALTAAVTPPEEDKEKTPCNE